MYEVGNSRTQSHVCYGATSKSTQSIKFDLDFGNNAHTRPSYKSQEQAQFTHLHISYHSRVAVHRFKLVCNLAVFQHWKNLGRSDGQSVEQALDISRILLFPKGLVVQRNTRINNANAASFAQNSYQATCSTKLQRLEWVGTCRHPNLDKIPTSSTLTA